VFGITEVPRCTDRAEGEEILSVVCVPRHYSMKKCKVSDGRASLMIWGLAVR